MPSDRWISTSSDCISRRSFSSSAPSGSSRRRMAGCVTRARARATRWRSPPESWLMRRSSLPERRTRPAPARTLRASPRRARRAPSAHSRHSRRPTCAGRARSSGRRWCNFALRPAGRRRRRHRSPVARTEVGCSRPEITRSRVVLPDPLSPRMVGTHRGGRRARRDRGRRPGRTDERGRSTSSIRPLSLCPIRQTPRSSGQLRKDDPPILRYHISTFATRKARIIGRSVLRL